MARLRRVHPDSPGWTRRRRGTGFVYLDEDLAALDADDVARCKALVIPPAWTQVWICPAPNGHIQAVGTDDAGRRQYLYHPVWREQRDRAKHDRVLIVARRLPEARKVVATHMAKPGMPKERALGTAFRLLDLGFFRVGSEVYAEENESYGLATVRREHVTVKRNEVVFDFPAKSGQRRVQSIRDAAARRAIEAMYRRRSGPEDLLAYRQGSEWRDVRSDDINAYIHERIGAEYTAKNFRTWHGTVLAAVALAGEPPPRSDAAAKRAIARAVDEVSEALGNTPAVCRASYIDPRVLDRYRDGSTINPAAPANGRLSARARMKIEREVLALVS
jgi:DNA topoisomerase I